MRVTAARTLVISCPALKAVVFASATVRAASCGSPSTRRIASSRWQSGSFSACCRRSTAFTLVGKRRSPRAAWAAIVPKASILFTAAIIRLRPRRPDILCTQSNNLW
jgi:hypothetical protein